MIEPETSPVQPRTIPQAALALLVSLYLEARAAGVLAAWAGCLGNRAALASTGLTWALPSECDAPAAAPPDPQPAQLPQPGGRGEGPRSVQPEAAAVRSVEDALRRLDDYTYLAGHPLAGWRLVQRRLPAGPRTSLDRGKAVYHLLAEAIEKLRPPGRLPSDPPPRVWHPYLALHEAYVLNTPNRDFMCRLYISEGTFNRTRRAAVQAVTRWLEEMEAALEA